MTQPDFITLAHSPWRTLAKRIEPNTIKDYDRARTFHFSEHIVANLDHFYRIQSWLLHEPHRAMVRGAIADRSRIHYVRRMCHPDNVTGDLPTLREQPHRLLILDVEGVDRPSNIPVTDLVGCARAAIGYLPAPFHGARCMIQATAGHGIKPDCRLRLTYWMSEALGKDHLKYWFRATSIVDPSVFETAQLIYTAAPVFARGVRDHLPERITSLPGAEEVEAPPAEELQPPPRQAPYVLPSLWQGSARSDLYVRAALSSAFDRIITASKRHPVILSEACGLARFVHAGLLTCSNLKSVLWEAAQRAGKTDENEIDRILEFALVHSSVAQLPTGPTHA
jgi:hypothetical protein